MEKQDKKINNYLVTDEIVFSSENNHLKNDIRVENMTHGYLSTGFF